MFFRYICVKIEKHFSDKSNVHNVVQLEQFLSTDFEGKKEILRNDLQELEKSIFPKYQESSGIITTQKTDQRKHSQKLKSDLNKQVEALHRDIKIIIQRKQSEIDAMEPSI